MAKKHQYPIAVENILNFYNVLEQDDNYDWVRWTDKRRRFSLQSANEFFIGVMLDQGQLAERAWEGSRHLVRTHFNCKGNWWQNVICTHHSTVTKICKKGFNEKTYASVFTVNKFPKRLRKAAAKIIEEYDGDPRNIWKVGPKNVDEIYSRFKEFDGIGDALAKMAQFILVRNYGVAGGLAIRNQLSVKPDVLVRRVLFRTGITESDNITKCISAINELSLPSPADFDAATWEIGRSYCFKSKPNCSSCPINTACNYHCN